MAGNAPSQSPSPTEIRSDQEAFSQASESLWNAYFKEYTKALKSAEVPVADLKPYLTPEEYTYIAERIRAIRNEGVKVSGEVSTRGFRVLSLKARTALVCVDNESSRLIGKGGKDVTPAGRDQRTTLRLVFNLDSHKLLLDRDEKWTKSSAC